MWLFIKWLKWSIPLLEQGKFLGAMITIMVEHNYYACIKTHLICAREDGITAWQAVFITKRESTIKKKWLKCSCNVGMRDLPDMYARSPRNIRRPRAEGILIRWITSAHVTSNTYASLSALLPYLYNNE